MELVANLGEWGSCRMDSHQKNSDTTQLLMRMYCKFQFIGQAVSEIFLLPQTDRHTDHFLKKNPLFWNLKHQDLMKFSYTIF